MSNFNSNDGGLSIDAIASLAVLTAEVKDLKETVKSYFGEHRGLEERVSSLEGLKAQAIVVLSILTVGGGTLASVSQLYFNSLIKEKLDRTSMIDMVCEEYRESNPGAYIPWENRPKLCQ